MPYQSRAWLWTFNNYPAIVVGDQPPWHEDGDYSIYSLEVGDQGTPHLQGFTYFARKTTIGGIRLKFTDLWDGIHIGDADGRPSRSVSGSIAYVEGLVEKKGMVLNPDIHAFGERPKQDRNSGADYESARRAAEDGRFDDIPAILAVKHWSSFQGIAKHAKMIQSAIEPSLEPIAKKGSGLWIWGPKNCGKTTLAKTFGTYYKHHMRLSPFTCLDGYKGEPIIILEDFSPQNAVKYGHLLKQWCDVDPVRWELDALGHTLLCRPKKVIVTSNWSIEQLWTDPNVVGPLLARFDVTHMTHVYAD